MKQRLYYDCLFLFMLCEVKASKSDHLLNRLVRAVNGTSLYSTNQNWHNNKPSNNNWSQLNNQWNNNNNSFKPNLNNHQPQNTYGYNVDRNGYPTKQLGWNGTGTQWHNPNGGYGQVYLNNGSNYPPQNTQGYISGSNGYPAKPVGWNGASSPDPNRHYQPSGFNGPSSQWNTPGSNYNQANLNNPNSNPIQMGWTPQFNGNSNGYNNKPAIWNSTGSQRNNLGNQHYASPNDLMIHHYKRSIDHRSYNGSWHNTDPAWHSDNKKPLWNGTRSHWNNTDSRYYQGRSTSFNNTSGYNRLHNRLGRSIHHHSKHSNISWYNIDPKWYNITLPTFNGTHWNTPGGHYYQWIVNNRGSRHHHKHHDQHETGSTLPSQYGPLPQFGPPPQNIPPHYHGPPPNTCNYPTAHLYPYHREPWHPRQGSDSNFTYPYMPRTDFGSNSTVINGTSLSRPENGTSLDATVTNVTSAWVPESKGSTNVTGKDPWGPEITDMNNSDRASNTPDPL